MLFSYPRILLALNITFFLFWDLYAQPVQISGKLLDASNKSPLPFATILFDNSTKGTSTNLNGEFIISINQFPATLLFSYVGYRTEKVEVTKNEENLIVLLQPLSYLLQEVSVYSKRESGNGISSTELQNQQAKKFAGMTKDALRTIQLMPGVSVNNEANARFNVRGGTYDENLVLINGVEVYNPFHIKEAAMASIGVFNIDMIKNIDFSAGGFGAEYGNALSSLLRIDYASGDKQNYSGRADLSFVDLSLLYNGPINSKSTFNFGLRKSYLDYLLRWTKIRSDVYVGYYDAQGQIDYEFSPQHKLKLNFIYSGDEASIDKSPESTISNNYQKVNNKQTLVTSTRYRNRPFDGNYYIGLISLISENVFSSAFSSRSSLSFYNEIEDEISTHNDSTNYSYKDYPNYWSLYTHTANLSDQLEIKTISFKHDFLVQLAPYSFLKSGVSFQKIFFNYSRSRTGADMMKSNIDKYPVVSTKNYPPDPQYNDTSYLNTSSYKLGAYIQHSYQVSEILIFESGIRADYFDINKEFVVSPRLNLAFKAPYGFTLRSAVGIFYQPPTFKQLRSSESKTDNTRYQMAVHYILGVDKTFGDNFYFRTEFYFKDYSDLIPATKSGEGALSYGKKLNNAIGYAEGFDIQINTQFDWFNFWLNYGYLVAEEKIDLPNQSYYPRYSDQRHTLSAVLNFDIGAGWQIDLRAFYGSGYAYTPSYTVWDQTQQIYKWVAGTKNSDHYSPYERIDFRLSKEFSLFSNSLTVYADVLNVLNRKNVLYYKYNYDEQGRPRVEEISLFGIIPTVGVSYSF